MRHPTSPGEAQCGSRTVNTICLEGPIGTERRRFGGRFGAPFGDRFGGRFGEKSYLGDF